MISLLEKFNKSQIVFALGERKICEFRPGDDLEVVFKFFDTYSSERIQVFEGVCISKRNRGLHSSFLVRKVSHGESIISQFFIYSPNLISVKVKKIGRVRRAKLYYLCNLFGKSARIKEGGSYNS